MATLSSHKRTRQSPQVETEAWSVQAAVLSDRGQVRTGNEDSVYVEPAGSLEARARGVLCVVADGMGGYNAGEVASRLAVQGIRNRYYAGPSTVIVDALRTAIETTNLEVWQQAQRQPEMNGMGCTLTAAVIHRNELIIGHVGDSRAYLVRNNGIAQVTRDHSWVEEQVEAGALTREQANRHPQRNVILRAVGAKPDIAVDLFQEKVEPGDVVVQCSDGLSTLVSDEEIGRTVLDLSPEMAVRQLVGLANQRGAPDNVTVAVLQVHGPAQRKFVRMRRWWPFAIAAIVLLALGAAIVFANRGPEPAAQPLASPVPALAQVVTTAAQPTVVNPTATETRAQNTTTPVATLTPRAAHVVAGGAYLRSTPDLGPTTILRELPGGENVTIVGESQGPKPDRETDRTWYEITTSKPNEQGWIYNTGLTFDSSSPATQLSQSTPARAPSPTAVLAPTKPRAP